MKTLIIEDDPKTGGYLWQRLVEAAFVADRARTGFRVWRVISCPCSSFLPPTGR